MNNNYNLPKFKNLAKYLKIDNINDDNFNEIVNSFFLLNKKYTDNSNCNQPNCFCGRRLKHYYYIINTKNGDILIVGGVCKNIFYSILGKDNKLSGNKINSKFWTYFKDSFSTGIFDKINDWDKYIETCIKKYMEDCDSKRYDLLIEKYKDNKFILKYIQDNKPINKQVDEILQIRKKRFFGLTPQDIKHDNGFYRIKRGKYTYMTNTEIRAYFMNENNYNFDTNKYRKIKLEDLEIAYYTQVDLNKIEKILGIPIKYYRDNLISKNTLKLFNTSINDEVINHTEKNKTKFINGFYRAGTKPKEDGSFYWEDRFIETYFNDLDNYNFCLDGWKVPNKSGATFNKTATKSFEKMFGFKSKKIFSFSPTPLNKEQYLERLEEHEKYLKTIYCRSI